MPYLPPADGGVPQPPPFAAGERPRIGEAVADGIVISEFPTTREAAESARD